jgi:hypothetical protein
VNDTSARASAIMNALLASKTPSERVEMACSMFEFARELASAGIKMQHGPRDGEHMRKHLFLRLYGQDLSDEKKRRILAFWATR